MAKTLVIIPTYNERENIAKLVESVTGQNLGLDILVVDDGNDGTDQLILELQKTRENLFLIHRSGKGGRGSAVIEGLKYGLEKNYDFLVEMDADFSHDPQALGELLAKAAPDTVVIGSRYMRGSKIVGWPLSRRIFSKFANFYASVVLGLGYSDYTNGYRVYPAALVRKLDLNAIRAKGYIVLSELSFALSKVGAEFAEVPIVFVNRARGVSNFSLKEIKEAFLSVVKVRFAGKWLELLVLALLSLSFFVGLAHALPLTNVISDESPNVGGVLRALENKTVLPAVGDVPYATVTYLLSYVFVAAYLALAWPFFGFDLAALKEQVVDNLSSVYLVTRGSSAVLAIIAAALLYKFSRRASITVLVMTSIIVTAMFRTTKVWVLTTVLTLASLYYLYAAITAKSRRAIFWSILFAALSLANFPFNFYAVGLAVAVLLFVFRRERQFYGVIFKSALAGTAVVAAVTAMNWQNILDQVATILSSPAAGGIDLGGTLASFWLYLKRTVLMFPFLLMPLLFTRGIRDRVLFWLSLLYLAVYLAAISIVAPWVSSVDPFLRYLVPVAFFLGLILASLEFRWNKILAVSAALSFLVYALTLCYLARPTTYNLAADWAAESLNSERVIIVNDVSRLQFPLNAKSAALLEERFCSTRCRQTIERNLGADFASLVVDARRKREDFDLPAQYYLFTNEPRPTHAKQIFGSAAPGEHFSMDNKLGLYFDFDYYRLKNLGEAIYVYEID